MSSAYDFGDLEGVSGIVGVPGGGSTEFAIAKNAIRDWRTDARLVTMDHGLFGDGQTTWYKRKLIRGQGEVRIDADHETGDGLYAALGNNATGRGDLVFRTGLGKQVTHPVAIREIGFTKQSDRAPVRVIIVGEFNGAPAETDVAP